MKSTLTAALLVVLSGCAAGSDGKSGETHFLCKTDDDCTKLGDGYVCAASYCARKTDAGSGEGGSVGSGGVPGSGGSTASGGTSGGAGAAGEGGSSDSGTSDCLACVEDRDCPAEQRCALNACGSSASGCSPISVSGPRGSWVSLDVTRASGPCPTLGGCTSTWHVAPDGHVTGTSEGNDVDSQLSAAQLDQFRGYVDGASLRTALRDGLPCMEDMVTDVGMTVTLELTSTTLSKQANGCIGTDNVLTKIYDVLSRL